MSLRRLFTWLIAAAFIFNGAALLAVSAALAPFPDAHHATSMANNQSTHFGSRQDADGMMSGQNHAQSREHVDGSLKCCHMCMAEVIVPIVPMTLAQFSYASVLFLVGQDNPPNDFVSPDPGIPKFVI